VHTPQTISDNTGFETHLPAKFRHLFGPGLPCVRGIPGELHGDDAQIPPGVTPDVIRTLVRGT